MSSKTENENKEKNTEKCSLLKESSCKHNPLTSSATTLDHESNNLNQHLPSNNVNRYNIKKKSSTYDMSKELFGKNNKLSKRMKPKTSSRKHKSVDIQKFKLLQSEFSEILKKKSSSMLSNHKLTNKNELNVKDDSIHQPNDSGMNISRLIAHIENQGVGSLLQEYKFIEKIPLSSTYEAFKKNDEKNRYSDIVCLDDSRVGLKNCSVCESDYIHANYVDGYKQKNAYIGTQGPLDETIEDFWHMIWQENTVVIVMLTNVIENNRIKCAQYWPLEKNENMKLALFEIENVKTDKKDDYVITELEITNKKTNEKRFIKHCHFVSWPDHGVPDNPSEMLGFVSEVRGIQSSSVQELLNNKKWSGHRLGPPIVVHCSAGIGRTGTFFTIDITINRLLDVKKVNIEDTVIKIRSQRASSVQMKEQYVFCYKAIVEYLIEKKLLENEKFKDYNKNSILNELFPKLYKC